MELVLSWLEPKKNGSVRYISIVDRVAHFHVLIGDVFPAQVSGNDFHERKSRHVEDNFFKIIRSSHIFTLSDSKASHEQLWRLRQAGNSRAETSSDFRQFVGNMAASASNETQVRLLLLFFHGGTKHDRLRFPVRRRVRSARFWSNISSGNALSSKKRRSVSILRPNLLLTHSKLSFQGRAAVRRRFRCVGCRLARRSRRQGTKALIDFIFKWPTLNAGH